jgi:hypothetical protein
MGMAAVARFADGDVGGSRIYQVHFLLFEIPRCLLCRLQIALHISDCQNKLFPLFKPQLAESGPKPVNCFVPCALWEKDTNTVDLRLLRLGDSTPTTKHSND